MEPSHITVEMMNQIIRSCEKTIVQNIALIQELERRYPDQVQRTLNVTLIMQQQTEREEDEQD